MTVHSILLEVEAELARAATKHPIRPVSIGHWSLVCLEEILEAQEALTKIGLIVSRGSQAVIESLDCRDRDEAMRELRGEIIQSISTLVGLVAAIDTRLVGQDARERSGRNGAS